MSEHFGRPIYGQTGQQVGEPTQRPPTLASLTSSRERDKLKNKAAIRFA